jgi:hypothetical protein
MSKPGPDSELDLLSLAEMIKANAEEISADILARWERIGRTETWHRLPEDLDHDHMPQLIRAMAAAALGTEFDRSLCERVVDLAAQHGYHRSREGLDEALIYREYHLLRRALWERLKTQHGENATVYYAAMRLDTLISLTTAAAVHGWNREGLTDVGRWPDALEELLTDWPLPR